MVNNPAKEDVFESHSGAETMPVHDQHSDLVFSRLPEREHIKLLTILDEDGQALLDQQSRVKND